MVTVVNAEGISDNIEPEKHSVGYESVPGCVLPSAKTGGTEQ